MKRKLQIFSNVGSADTAFFSAWCNALAEQGWEVETVSSITSAEYRQARTRLQRLVVRWKMYPGFILQIIRACRRDRSATRIVTTNPFFAPWLVSRVADASARTVMLLYDLFPDALEMGPSGRWSLIQRGMAATTRGALRRCEAVVFLGERLKEHVEARYLPARQSAVIAVGADALHFPGPLDSEPAWRQPLPILYCGQLGRMHETETLAGVLHDMKQASPIRFAFHASGVEYGRFQTACAAAQEAGIIQCLPPLPLQEWSRTMQQFPIGLITLRSGAEKVAMPSKTYSAMAAGQAILAIAPAQSDLARLIHRHDCGWVIEPGDQQGLQQILAEIVADRGALQQKRLRAQQAARSHYDMPIIAREWAELLERLEQ